MPEVLSTTERNIFSNLRLVAFEKAPDRFPAQRNSVEDAYALAVFWTTPELSSWRDPER